MSKLPGWLGRFGAELTELGERLDERRARAAADDEPFTAKGAVPDDELAQVPAPPSYAPSVAAKPDPVAALPWGGVAAEAGWRLLVLAGTLWVLMRVISAVQLVVLAFAAALLVTAMLQPTVVRLKRFGLPHGLATAVTAVLGFVIIGLVGSFSLPKAAISVGHTKVKSFGHAKTIFHLPS
ncbi:AI-2E family transporter [Streptomyces californicus]